MDKEEKYVCEDCGNWFFRHTFIERCPYCYSENIVKVKL
jgi:rubrerythrin